MDKSPAARLFGMGTGRYPATYRRLSSERIAPAVHTVQQEQGKRYLLLTPGDPMYIEQFVTLSPQRRYRLSFSARSDGADAELALPLCEKWMLYSARCIWMTASIGATGGQWRQFSWEVDSATLGRLPWYAPRPVKLSLFNPSDTAMVEIDQVSLRADDGVELIRNGDFSAGMDRWFFTGDNHLPWHLENLWLQLYLEQGALGVLAFAALLAYGCLALWKLQRGGDLYAPALAGGLAAFAALSAVDSLFDFPRISLLFGLILAQVLWPGRRS
jgi:hypothetical protein